MLITEALFVGLYCLILYALIKPIGYLWFLFGFLKHFAGYYLGLHSYYCQLHTSKKDALDNYIIQDSLLEGVLFFVIGFVIDKIKYNKYLTVFITGISIHILAEFVGIHKYFCDHRCI